MDSFCVKNTRKSEFEALKNELPEIDRKLTITEKQP
jgi:hypothetical protein